MVEPAQIREVVSAYLADGNSDKFLLSFSPLSYNIHKNGTPEAIDLANQVEFALADVRIGPPCGVDKAGFLKKLEQILQGSFNG